MVNKVKNQQKYIDRAYGTEPEWTGADEDFDAADILKSINWYVTKSDKRNYKKWTLDWMKDKRSSWTKEDFDFAKRSNLKEFKTYGHYCRMLSRGFPQVEELTATVNTYINNLISLGKRKKESNKEKVVISPRERMENQVTELAGELMNLCDIANESIMNKTDDYKKTKIYQWLKGNEVGYRQAEMLGTVFSPALAELDELLKGEDTQLMEGYSYLGKRQQKSRIRQRFFKFHLASGLAALLNYLIFLMLFLGLGVYDIFANLIGIAIAAIANYLINSNWTWRREA